MEWLLVDDMGSILDYQSYPPHLGRIGSGAREHFALGIPQTTHVFFLVERIVIIIIILED